LGRLKKSIEKVAELDIELLLPGHMGIVSGKKKGDVGTPPFNQKLHLLTYNNLFSLKLSLSSFS
jgi:hypothetical protein